MKAHSRLAAALLPLTLALSAAAAPVTYSYSGVVDDDEAGRGFLLFAGSFTFDSAASDGIADPFTAAYAHAGAPWGLSIAFDGGPLLTLADSFNVLVSNDLAGGDQWGQLAQDALQSVSLSLFDFSGTVFGSDTLPLPDGGLTLAPFAASLLRWETAEGALQGHLTALACSAGCGAAPGDPLPGDPTPGAPLPEPSSLLLCGLGLAAMRLFGAAKGRA